jgi:CRISPR-associated protein Cas1
MKDLHLLPKVRDSWSYLYVEHARIEQEARAIAVHDAQGRVPVPAAKLTTLMLGPGTAVTHAAIRSLADNGCLVVWCGEEGIRFYAQGVGETRSAANLLHQARMWADPECRHQVVIRLYQMRFREQFPASLSLRVIRGKEGIRVRRAYQVASRETGIPWKGRSYNAGEWGRADVVNRALSAANSCLYGICHAAILSAGFSPALGFIHTGKMLSFVYDIADLYKTEISVPAAFHAAAEGVLGVERRVRAACRDEFKRQRLLARIIPDIQRVLALRPLEAESEYDGVEVIPGGIWDPQGEVQGGVNYGETFDGEDE